MVIIKKVLLLLLSLFTLCRCQSNSGMNQDNLLNILNVSTRVVEKLSALGSDSKPEKAFNEYRVIAHSFGGVDGHRLTGSLDAFLSSYSKGDRVFEIDLDTTSDGYKVLVHGWDWFNTMAYNDNGENALSLQQFSESILYNQYIPLTLDDLFYILEKYQDIYIVVDSKTFVEEQYKEVYQIFDEYIEKVDKSLYQRIIPQAYDFDMYTYLKNNKDYENLILTCYSLYVDSDGQQIFNFVKENDVKTLVMHMDNDWAVKVITDVYAYAGYANYQDQFKIFIHTINSKKRAEEILNDYHFDGIYSDYLYEKDFVNKK